MNACTWGRRHVCTVAAAVAVLLAQGRDARAQTGPVKGTVKLPDPSLRGDPPERNRGFLPRMSNPIIAPLKYDPLPWLVVVLEPRGELDEEQRQPPKVPATYRLVGEAFASPLFAVAAGGEVSIRNDSRHPRQLYSPTDGDLLAGDTINPKGDRIAKIATPYRVIEIRDKESPHLVGRIVAFPLRYTSLVAADGSFEIADVPAGKWEVRLWYRDGWLAHKRQTVTVAGRRGARVQIALPAVLEVERPAAGGEGK